MIVLKFGGTSVQDATSQNQALEIVFSKLEHSVVLVSSAMTRVTNELIRLTELASSGKHEEANTLLNALESRHYSVLDALCTGPVREKITGMMEPLFSEIKSLTRGMVLLKECSPRVYDAVVGCGELLSTRLLFARCLELGVSAELADARELIVTDDHFGEAAVLWEQTRERIRKNLNPRPGHLIITQGFLGSTEDGVATILGRGGSDYSATIFGAALDVEAVEIWTDVNGIMTTDPRIVASAKTIPEITYEEAAELAYFGAKVVHPATIQPAVEKGIPVWVKNTKNPGHLGTAILPTAPGSGPRAFAIKRGAVLISVASSRMLNAYGFLARIFEIFLRHKVAVDLVATSEVSVSMTVDSWDEARQTLEELGTLGTVSVERERGILCLVGREAWTTGADLSRVFGALGPYTIHLISLGASETNLSLVLHESDLEPALAAVHKEFFHE